MKKMFLLAALSAVLFSCKKDDIENSVFVGAESSLHHGKTWSWIHTDKTGKPLELGLSINEAALNSVPVGDQGGGDHHSHDNSLFVQLPAKALEVTPFKTVMLDWNPSGHPPFEFYGEEHFDIHFYMMDKTEILAMEDAKLAIAPADGYLPTTYMSAGPVPKMGTHWIDVTSPEFSGGGFTQTFIYGSYNGNINFYEPMITLNFLKATNTFERAIPQPAKFQQAGYYPTKMKVVKRNGASHIVLTDFVQRSAS